MIIIVYIIGIIRVSNNNNYNYNNGNDIVLFLYFCCHSFCSYFNCCV